jgi:hypothetical protein
MDQSSLPAPQGPPASQVPSDIAWEGGPPAAKPQQPAATAAPSDIVWAPAPGASKKQPGDYHVLKAFARGALSTLEQATGSTPAEMAYRHKLLGLDEPVAGKGDTAAEFVGGMLAPAPGGIAKEGLGAAASWAADKTKLTLGQRTGSEVVQYIERSIARLPGGDFLRHAIRSQNEQLGNQSAALVDRLAAGSDTTATGAGNVIKQQLKVAAKTMRAAAGEDYDAVDKLIPPDTKIGVKSTLQTLVALTTPTPGAENVTKTLIDPTLKAMREGLEADLGHTNLSALPYDTLKQLRTKVGSMIEHGPFSTDARNGQFKKVYEALTADMYGGAAEHSPAAADAVRKANLNYAASKDKQKVLKSVIAKAGGPEKVFSALISGTKEGASTLTQVVSALDGPSKQILAASALERMGRAVPGVQNAASDTFSATTFLTNWNRMAPEARDVMFGQLPGDYAKQVTQLATNAEALKSYERVLVNPSGTGQAVLWGGEVGATLLALMTGQFHIAAGIIGSAAGTAAVSAALTHPQTSAWLARKTGTLVISAAKGQMGVSGGKQGAPAANDLQPASDALGGIAAPGAP